jgi:hypothetical protein
MAFSTRIESRIASKRQAYMEGRSVQRRVRDFHGTAVKGSLLGDQRQAQPRTGSYRAGSALKALEYVVTLDAGHSRPVVLD